MIKLKIDNKLINSNSILKFENHKLKSKNNRLKAEIKKQNQANEELERLLLLTCDAGANEALNRACENRNLDDIKFLIESGVAPNKPSASTTRAATLQQGRLSLIDKTLLKL